MDKPTVNSAPKKWYQKWWGILIIIFLMIVLGLVISFGIKVWQEYQGITQSGVNLGQFAEDRELSGVVEQDGEYYIIPEADDDPNMGPEDANVTVISFQDFECPYCAKAFPAYRATMERYKDRVRFVFRDHAYPPSIHPYAESAAMAAECADDQNKFWEFHDKIFLNQEQLSTTNLKVWAAELGLDVEIFNDCLDSERYRYEIEKDITEGQYGGVQGTPTFFINGHRVQGTLSEEVWSKILDYFLNQY